jgi:hypothetical protein
MITLARPVAVGLALAAAGPQAPPSPTPSPAACSAPEYRQFDFWLGEWNVYDPKGQIQGTNRITRELGGCVLQERWVAAGPVAQEGSSFNTWSPAAKRWHQTWVDSTGGFLLLDGVFENGVMTLRGEMPARSGGTVRHRIAWSALAGGRLRQFWERSTDGGQTWTVAFDGTYVRRN